MPFVLIMLSATILLVNCIEDCILAFTQHLQTHTPFHHKINLSVQQCLDHTNRKTSVSSYQSLQAANVLLLFLYFAFQKRDRPS